MTGSEHGNQFVSRLHALLPDESRGRQGDRAALAALRRSAGHSPGEVPAADRVFYGLLPSNVPQWDERPYWLVATLFAQATSGTAAPTGGISGGLGRSLRRYEAKRSAEGARDVSPGLERRFLSALGAPLEDLEAHLRGLVRQVAGEGIPVAWDRLLRDLRDWQREDRRAQRRWARDFWNDRADEPEISDAAAAMADTSPVHDD